MKKLILFGAAGLLLGACGDDQANQEPTPVESPDNETDGGQTEETGVEENNVDDTEESGEDTGNNGATDDTTGEDAQNMITVDIDFDIDDDIYDVDEDAWEQRIEVEEGTTLLEAMREHYDIEEEGGVITSIEGYAQDESRNAYWIFDVNDEQSPEGAGEYILQNNDEIEWELDD